MQRLGARLGLLVVGVTALAAFGFFGLYLLRWEWHRALIAGLIMVGAEVAGGVVLVFRRLSRSQGDDDRLASLSGQRQRDVDFKWLGGGNDYGVFVPLLLGGGVIVSAVAWVVERIARGTARSASSVPDHYRSIALPGDPLVPRDDEVRVRGLPEADDEHLRRLLGPRGALP